MPSYDTLVEALNDAKKRGYTTDFNLAFDALKCQQTGTLLSPAEFEIMEYYRFEGLTNPDDSSILYLLESLDGKMKGVLVSAYGVYSDPVSDGMIQKLKVHH